MSNHATSSTPAPPGRFRKGSSGNPKGRPRKQAREDPASAFDVIIDRTLTITQDGEPREVTVDEALQIKTWEKALTGCRTAQRAIIDMIKERERYLAARRQKSRMPSINLRFEGSDPANADQALLLLGIACHNPERQDYPFDREQLLLEPWAVQTALTRRRGGTRLTQAQIDDIRRSTREPNTLRLPEGADP